MTLIAVNSLSKSFGAEDLFSGVTFSIAKGARFALVGPFVLGLLGALTTLGCVYLLPWLLKSG
jgi:ABC-type branched-subunit amino acid transport system ATPase component